MNNTTTRPALCKCGCGQEVPLARFPSQQRKYIGDHQPNFHRPVAERFWLYVAVGQPDECWPWKGTLNNKGYGVLVALDNVHLLTHRLSWEIHFGPIPVLDNGRTACVLHKCDNPQCVNPLHLFLGTYQDNMDDKMRKGRYNYDKSNNKLSDADIVQIRQMAAQGIRQRQIAQHFGVSDGTISMIVNGKIWMHVP